LGELSAVLKNVASGAFRIFGRFGPQRGMTTVAIQDRENSQNPNQNSVPATWTSREAYLLAAICLLAGIALGYLYRGSSSPVPASAPSSSTAAAAAGMNPQAQMPTADMVNQMAASLLARVQSNPADVDALVQLGNLYMDHRQYAPAIQYYAKALEVDPKNVNVRTDMGTCYFYTGDPKRAVEEFDKSLKLDPNHAQTLFNLGVVQQDGLKDSKAAVATWQKLLATNPNYENRDKVQQLIAAAKQ
jgi:cytochrome c-type biogenesis protein CcmH/NrfG